MGFRSMFIGSIRDPTLIACIDDFLEGAKAQTAQVACPELLTDPEHYKIIFHIFGKNATMGALEPSTQVSHEIGVL